MKMYNLIITSLIAIAATACRSDELKEIVSEDNSDIVVEIETPDWTELTHSNNAEPDFTTVFPDDKVHRIDITISAESWSAMQSDLAQNMGSTGGRPGGFGGPGGGGAEVGLHSYLGALFLSILKAKNGTKLASDIKAIPPSEMHIKTVLTSTHSNWISMSLKIPTQP